jgi:prophage antirepressor-like protein
MSAIALRFGNHPITVVTNDAGEPEWIADEVCAALGIADHKQSLRHLDADEKGMSTVHTPGGPQRKATINLLTRSFGSLVKQP